MVPDVVAETVCATEYSGCGISDVDSCGAADTQPRRDPAQVFDYREAVATWEPAAPLDVERADADDRILQVCGFQRRKLGSVAAQRFIDDSGEAFVGEWQPGQPGDRLAVPHQPQQYRRHRQTGRVVEGAVDRVEHPHQPRVDVGAAVFLAVHLDTGRGHQRVDDF